MMMNKNKEDPQTIGQKILDMFKIPSLFQGKSESEDHATIGGTTEDGDEYGHNGSHQFDMPRQKPICVQDEINDIYGMSTPSS